MLVRRTSIMTVKRLGAIIEIDIFVNVIQKGLATGNQIRVSCRAKLGSTFQMFFHCSKVILHVMKLCENLIQK